MAIYSKERPGWQTILAGGIGEGIGEGLSRLAAGKVAEIEQRKLGDRYEKLGLPRDLAGAPTHIQSAYAKEHMRKQALSNIPQINWESLGTQTESPQAQQQSGMLDQLSRQPNPEETPWLAQQFQKLGTGNQQMMPNAPRHEAVVEPQRPAGNQAAEEKKIMQLYAKGQQYDAVSPGSGKAYIQAAKFLENKLKINQRGAIANMQESGKKERFETKLDLEREKAATGREAAVAKQNAPFWNDIREKIDASNILESDLESLENLLNSGKVSSGIWSKVTPTFLMNTETQQAQKIIQSIALNNVRTGDRSTDKKIERAEASFAQLEHRPETQKALVSKRLLLNKIPFIINEKALEIVEENQGVEPFNLQAKAYRRAQPAIDRIIKLITHGRDDIVKREIAKYGSFRSPRGAEQDEEPQAPERLMGQEVQPGAQQQQPEAVQQQPANQMMPQQQSMASQMNPIEQIEHAQNPTNKANPNAEKMPFEDQVFKKQVETPTQAGIRFDKGMIKSATQGFLGAPGNIAKVVLDITDNLLNRVGVDITPIRNVSSVGLPTSEAVSKMFEYYAPYEGYYKPTSDEQKLTNNFIENTAEILSPTAWISMFGTGAKAAQKLIPLLWHGAKLSGAANLIGYGMQKSGFDKDAQQLAKIGVFLTPTVYNLATLGKAAIASKQAAMNVASESNLEIPTTRVGSQLGKSAQLLQKIDAPEANAALEALTEGIGRTTQVSKVVPFVDAMTDLASSGTLNPAQQKAVTGIIDGLNKALIGTDAAFSNPYQKYAGLKLALDQKSRIADFLTSKVDAIKWAGPYAAYMLGISAKTIGLVGASLKGAAISEKRVRQLMNNPSVRKHYADVVKAALREDAPAAVSAIQKFQKVVSEHEKD